METKKIEWFEIIEPCTKEEVYVNMYTGECVWQPPPGVLIKSDDNLWWEIYDDNSSRYYYYNAASQKTVWQRPGNCDVLSLCKVQALKQSIYDLSDEDTRTESTATQTTAKISAKNLPKAPGSLKCASTQTPIQSISPERSRVRHGLSSNSEHALSSYSYDSGCSADSGLTSHSHSSLDSTNYQCYRKIEFCSTEQSVDATYYPEQNALFPRFSKQWNKNTPEPRPPQRPVLGNLVPVWQQHSFECWGAPPGGSSFEMPPLHRRHLSQSFSHAKGKANLVEPKKRSTPQHYRKPDKPKNSFSFCMDSASIPSDPPYPPDMVSTPRRHVFQNPEPLMQQQSSFKKSKNNLYYPSYQQNMPIHTYQNVHIIPDLILPAAKAHRPPMKISPDYHTREPVLSRRRYYNSCKHIYENDPGLLNSAPCCYQGENYLSPLQQYLMEQAKLSGNLCDDDKDSYSDDSDGPRDDEGHFADDEGMSHHDSSSLEYLDNYVFFDENCGDLFYSPLLQTVKGTGFKFPKSHEAEDSFSSRKSHQEPHLPSYYDSVCGKSEEHLDYSGILDGAENDTNGDDIQKYAEDNLNRHTKGIFRKKFSLQDMLSWSKDPIRKPMITTTDKSLKRDACEVFKLIQTYMLDHKAKNGQTYEEIVLDIATRGWSKPALRDELYIQICRQTTENPKRESLVLGWELMAVCLTFFPPSVKFQPYLEGYIKKHQSNTLDAQDLKISQYAVVCGKRLEQISHKGAARSSRKPTLEEIEQSRLQIFRPSMFGNSLEEVMSLQRKRFPNYCLPWIQTTLSEAVLQLNGAQTEGIFRVPGDVDEINSMKLKIDQWEVMECDDPHVPASLLKQWYRELFEPLIPPDYYEECVAYCNDPDSAISIVNNLPELNRLVFSYLIRFLQVFAAEENCAVTKMDAKNLAMVMAPNCLRCVSQEPSVIFENTRKEMAFIQTLIQHLNTQYMEAVI